MIEPQMNTDEHRWSLGAFVGVVLMIAILATGCNGTSKKIVTGCIVGNWEVTEAEPFGHLTIPAGALGNYTAEFQGGGGSIGYLFGDNGVLTVVAQNALIKFNLVSGQETLALEIQIDGQASAEYTLEGDLVKVGAFKGGEMDYRAIMDNEPMMDSKLAYEFLPLFVDPYKSAHFVCTDQTLSLQLFNYPGGTQPISLERIAVHAPQQGP
jgi:hypothetical protein